MCGYSLPFKPTQFPFPLLTIRGSYREMHYIFFCYLYLFIQGRFQEYSYKNCDSKIGFTVDISQNLNQKFLTFFCSGKEEENLATDVFFVIPILGIFYNAPEIEKISNRCFKIVNGTGQYVADGTEIDIYEFVRKS